MTKPVVTKKKPSKSVILSARIQEELDEKLQDIAIKEGVSKSQIVIDFLEFAVKSYENDSDQKE